VESLFWISSTDEVSTGEGVPGSGFIGTNLLQGSLVPLYAENETSAMKLALKPVVFYYIFGRDL